MRIVFDRMVTVQLKQNSESIDMTTATQTSTIDNDAISKRAYEIWEALGRPEGVADQTWAEAERQLTADVAKSSSKISDAPKASATVPETNALEAREAQPQIETPRKSSAPPAAPVEIIAKKKESQNTHRRGARR